MLESEPSLPCHTVSISNHGRSESDGYSSNDPICEPTAHTVSKAKKEYTTINRGNENFLVSVNPLCDG